MGIRLPKFMKKEKGPNIDTEFSLRIFDAMNRMKEAETPEEQKEWAEVLKGLYQAEVAKAAAEQKKHWWKDSEVVKVLLAGGFGLAQIGLILYGEDVGGKLLNGKAAQFIMKLRNRA